MNQVVKTEANEIKFTNQDGEVLVDSREVAEHFGKAHKHVLETINCITAENSALTKMFIKSNYKSGTGKNYPMYLMNRDGFTLLAMGFTGKKAMEWKLKYINAFNQMEEQLNSPELQIARALVEAKKLLESKEEEIILLNENIQDQASLLALAMGNSDRYIVRDIAKFYDMSAIKFNQLLNELKIQKKVDGRWILTKQYENNPYLVTTTKRYRDEEGNVTEEVQFNAWTNEGLKFLYSTLKENGYYPNVEQGGEE